MNTTYYLPVIPRIAKQLEFAALASRYSSLSTPTALDPTGASSITATGGGWNTLTLTRQEASMYAQYILNQIRANNASYGVVEYQHNTRDPWQIKLRERVRKIVNEAVPNWDSYGAEPPTPYARQRLLDVLISLGKDACDSVFIVPTVNGGFEASWDTPKRGFEIDIPSDTAEPIEYVTVEKVQNPETGRTDPILSTYEGGITDKEDEIAQWYLWVTQR